MFISPRLSFDPNKSLSLQPMAINALNKGWNSVPGTPTVADSGHNMWGVLPDRLQRQQPLAQEIKPAVLESSPLCESPPPSRPAEKVETAVNDQLAKALNQLDLAPAETTERLTSKDIQTEDDIECK